MRTLGGGWGGGGVGGDYKTRKSFPKKIREHVGLFLESIAIRELGAVAL